MSKINLVVKRMKELGYEAEVTQKTIGTKEKMGICVKTSTNVSPIVWLDEDDNIIDVEDIVVKLLNSINDAVKLVERDDIVKRLKEALTK